MLKIKNFDRTDQLVGSSSAHLTTWRKLVWALLHKLIAVHSTMEENPKNVAANKPERVAEHVHTSFDRTHNPIFAQWTISKVCSFL